MPTFRCGPVVVTMSLPGGAREQLDVEPGQDVQCAAIRITREGIHIDFPVPPTKSLQWVPMSLDGNSWAAMYDRCSADGIDPLTEWQRLTDERLSAPRSRGRPRRSERLDKHKSEFLSWILQRQAQHGESLVDAINSAARLHPRVFRKAFPKGRAPQKREAAKAYYKRRRRD